MSPESTEAIIRRVRRAVVFLAALNLALVAYGLVSYPKALTASINGPKGLAADVAILTTYALIGIYGTRKTGRIAPDSLRTGAGFGLAVAAVYFLVVESEYAVRLTPANGATLGTAMVVAVFALFLLAGIKAAYATRRISSGVLAATWSAILGTSIWFAVTMLTYYAFFGTAQQNHVLNVENHDDFVRSGMTDFRAFILQDFMGACFFHLLISPVMAAILGSLGGLIGVLGRAVRTRFQRFA